MKRNIVTICSYDSKLDMHVSGNDLKGCAQELLLYLVSILNYSPLIDFYRAFLVQNITLSL